MKVFSRLLRCLVVALAVVGPGLFASAEDSPQRPNILWIVSEDNGPFLGCYGYPDAKTLDKLASQGILYTHAFANAPVCAPARCTIITGMYPPSLGTQHMRSKNAVPPATVPFFTKYLKDAGYFCTNNSKTDYNLSPYQNEAWDMMSRGDHKKRKEGQPFFAVYNIGTSHESSLHKGLDRSLEKADVTIPPYHPDTPEIRANWAMYHKILTKMDSQVGEVLKKLDDEGVADDTIVIYYADHGGILPRSKRFLYDTGVHVPMIVRFGKNFSHLAAEKAGTKTNRIVSFVDLAPTVLSLASIDVPKHMQGGAFLGKQAAEPREYAYCFRGRMDERYDFSRAVRGHQFKYIRNYNPHRIYGQHLEYLWKMPATRSWEAKYLAGECEGPQRFFWEEKQPEELYDTEADPWEVNNLADDPKYADVLKKMRAANREHLLNIRDSGFIPEGMFQELSQGSSMFELVRDEDRYPLAKIMAAAETATSATASDLPKLVEMLEDPDSVIRYWGATGCAILREKSGAAEGELREALDARMPNVRIAAAEALAKQGEVDTALKTLTALMKHDNEWVALHAANVLEALGEDARPALAEISTVSSKSNKYINRAASRLVTQLKD